MGNAVWVVLVLAPVVLALAVAVHVGAGRRFSRPVRPWVEAAAYAPMAAVLLYAWGAAHMFTMDIGEACNLTYGQRWDPDYAGESLFPLSKKCNASFDLVPAYVNPRVFGLLVVIPVFLVVAVVANRTAKRKKVSQP